MPKPTTSKKAAFLTLLLAIIFVTGAEARVGQDTLVKPPRSPGGDKATTRLLRSDAVVADEAITGDDEDRVYVPGLSTISDKISSTTKRLANKFKPAKLTNEYDEVFKVVPSLHTPGVPIDAGDFLQWMKLVERYRERFGSSSFSNFRVVEQLRDAKSDEELMKFFLALRKIPGQGRLARKLEQFLTEKSIPAQKVLNEAWLNSGMRPKDVFKSLKLGSADLGYSSDFLQWLRFVEMYKVKTGGRYSDLRTYNFLMDKRPVELDSLFATAFQRAINTPDLKNVGENLQMQLFRGWLKRGRKPESMASLLGLPREGHVFWLPHNRQEGYKAFEAYTIYYAAERGGETMMKTVAKLFAADKPEAALEAVMKV